MKFEKHEMGECLRVEGKLTISQQYGYSSVQLNTGTEEVQNPSPEDLLKALAEHLGYKVFSESELRNLQDSVIAYGDRQATLASLSGEIGSSSHKKARRDFLRAEEKIADQLGLKPVHEGV